MNNEPGKDKNARYVRTVCRDDTLPAKGFRLVCIDKGSR